MKLLDVYVALNSGDITREEAAVALNLTPKNLAIRITKHGHRLPLVLSILDKIHDDEITREEAATELGVTVRTVNVLMANWSIQRPLANRPITNATAKVKWEVRKKFAIDFIRGTLNLEQASKAAGVGDRQMRRWVSELIQKHFGMVYKDLAELDISKLQRLAKAIEEAEHLEAATIHNADQISMGLKNERQEGIRRAAANKIARKAARTTRV
jgi:hypothetical protein